jgi:hypothetical protein
MLKALAVLATAVASSSECGLYPSFNEWVSCPWKDLRSPTERDYRNTVSQWQMLRKILAP